MIYPLDSAIQRLNNRGGSYLYEEEIDASYIRHVLRMTQTIPYKQHISSEIRRDFHLAKTRLSYRWISTVAVPLSKVTRKRKSWTSMKLSLLYIHYLYFMVKITRQWKSTSSRVLFQTKCAVYTAARVLCKTRPTFPGINGPYEVHASCSFHSKSMADTALLFFALCYYFMRSSLGK